MSSFAGKSGFWRRAPRKSSRAQKEAPRDPNQIARLFAGEAQLDPEELARRISAAWEISYTEAADAIDTMQAAGFITAQRVGWRKIYGLTDIPVDPGPAVGMDGRPLPEPPALAQARVAARPAPRPRTTGRWAIPYPAAVIPLLIIGALGIAWGASSTIWQEPFTAAFTDRIQNELLANFDQMRANEQAAQELIKKKHEQTREMQRSAAQLAATASPGDTLGKVEIARLDEKVAIVQGTEPDSLREGPGHYTSTALPGAKGNWTSGFAGHRKTYSAPFRDIDKMQKGDKVTVDMPYGQFIYSVESTKIVPADYTKAFDPVGYDRIVLTSCHPIISQENRILVYAKLERSIPAGSLAKKA